MMKNVKSFRGVFSHDMIPPILGDKKTSMIVNYDFYGNQGTHWVAIYVNPAKNFTEVFDSYGLPPSNIIQMKLKDFIKLTVKFIKLTIKFITHIKKLLRILKMGSCFKQIFRFRFWYCCELIRTLSPPFS